MKHYSKKMIPFLTLLLYPLCVHANDETNNYYIENTGNPYSEDGSNYEYEQSPSSFPFITPVININNQVNIPTELVNTSEINVPVRLHNTNSVQNAIEPSRFAISPDIPEYAIQEEIILPLSIDNYCVQDKQIQAHVTQTWSGLVQRKQLFTDPAKAIPIKGMYLKEFPSEASRTTPKKLVASTSPCLEYPPLALTPAPNTAVPSPSAFNPTVPSVDSSLPNATQAPSIQDSAIIPITPSIQDSAIIPIIRDSAVIPIIRDSAVIPITQDSAATLVPIKNKALPQNHITAPLENSEYVIKAPTLNSNSTIQEPNQNDIQSNISDLPTPSIIPPPSLL